MIRNSRHPKTVMLLLALTLLVAAITSIELGSTRVSTGRVVATLLGRGDWIDNLIVFDLRLPRIVVSILVGVGVATSGVILQGITRNDLAGPSTVGVNAGSGLGVVLVLVSCPTAIARLPWLSPVAAIAGAAAITVLVFSLAYRQGSVLPSRLLLVGIAVSFGAHAAMLMLSLRMSFSTYNSVVSWMSGMLAASNWNSICFLLPCCVALSLAAFSRARVLNAFSLGDDVAATLGIAVEWQRFLLLGIATVLTAACVAVGGQIGFLGLAAPHLARRLIGQRHGVLFPAAALCGAILLVLADSLGRHLFAPVEIPAGILVGILGGVYFLCLLVTTKG